jgi:hypothetical protein
MPAEKQVKAVAKKLQELNPGFDGKVTPTIDFLDVTGLAFVTDNVTDISPVRALPNAAVRANTVPIPGGIGRRRREPRCRRLDQAAGRA